MCRFFSLGNVARYRQLASGELTATERSSILKMLAEEWDAFTRVSPMTSVPQLIQNREVETNDFRP
jgi:hypothetical protein